MTAGNTRQRQQLSAEVKLKAIQEVRQGGMSVSQTCEKYHIRPSQFYQWERTAEQGATAALQGRKRGRRKVSPREEELMNEIERLRAVIAEISIENLTLKKGAWL